MSDPNRNFADALYLENESLKRERAMLVDLITDFLRREKDDQRNIGKSSRKFELALSATEPLATQWLEEKIAEARISSMALAITAIHAGSNEEDLIQLKLQMEEELRLAASKRKEQV
jgi:hypothetical protein